ncbi:MAG: hypothetical protein K9N10_02170 [Deltaproteobacteria bacterium]|nr:hypothetical protein [Deltaproteobacteria bacterium]
MKERWKLLTVILVFGAAYYVSWASPVIRRSGHAALIPERWCFRLTFWP